jgi:hypothetical protein
MLSHLSAMKDDSGTEAARGVNLIQAFRFETTSVGGRCAREAVTCILRKILMERRRCSLERVRPEHWRGGAWCELTCMNFLAAAAAS